MTFEQAAILLLFVGQLVIFALDRFRMEVVALTGLFIGVLLGLVPGGGAFSGFANPAFITVVEILLIVPVLGRSGLLEKVAARLPAARLGESGVLAILCFATAGLSAFMNNIGALALMIPVVTSVCQVTRLDSRRMLMPVSFAALLGGLCSVIGTPANLLVSQQLQQQTGQGFAFFDIAYAGVPAALVGLATIIWWTHKVLARKFPEEELPTPSRLVVTEIKVVEGSPLASVAVPDFPGCIHALRRNGRNLLFQRPGTRVEPDDEILLSIDLLVLEEWLSKGFVKLAEVHSADDRGRWVEAVVMPESTIVGSHLVTLESFAVRGVTIAAVATQNPRIEGSLADVRLGIGDILYLRGHEKAIREAAEEADILLLQPRVQEPSGEGSWISVGIFSAGVLLTAIGLMPPELAFGLVVLVLAATGALNLRKGLAELDWPILIMLAALIPLGLAVESTGAAAVLAQALLATLPSEHPLLLVAAVLAMAVIATPFVNNASTAIALGPIAVSIAHTASLPLEPFLIAVAIGASLDFLTPIGHHNNTVVMGIVGHRFTDFFRAGWPVTLAAYFTSLAAIWFAWM